MRALIFAPTREEWLTRAAGFHDGACDGFIAPTREEWLAARASGIGGSEVGAIMDFYFPGNARLDLRKTALDVYLAKTGQAEPKEETEAMYWGRKLEPVVAEVYAERTGRSLIAMKHRILQHPQHPVILASPDFLIEGEPGGLECKTAGYWPGMEWTDERVPDAHWLQCQHYLIQPGFSWWDLVPLIAGQRFAIHRIEPDADVQAVMIEHCERFWRDHVEKRVPPLCDHLPPTRDQVKRLFLRHRETEIGATEEIERAILEHIAMKREAKELDGRIEASENTVKLFMGNNAVCRGAQATATWKNNKEYPSVDWEAVARSIYEDAKAGREVAVLEFYEQKHTEIRPGARRFLTRENKNGK